MVQEYMFESFDGTELYGKTDSVADPRGVVVIVHGLCEHQGRYDYLTMRLNAQGYSVYRFDHRGHGRSKGTKVFYSAFDEIAKDIDVVVDRAIAENPESPLFIVGHSMGGYGALKCALTYPERYAGCISLSARCSVQNKLKLIENDPGQIREWQAILGEDLTVKPENDLYALLARIQKPAASPRFYVACGTEDFLFDANEHFFARFGKELPIEYHTEPGNHTWDFWDRYIERILAWLPLEQAEGV
jgi:pimeloyl-ACP methyl ester carboxylesterase